MKIGIVHQSLRLVGGGERVCLSLLKALDHTTHDVVLRCAEAPHGVSFAEGGGGEAGSADDAVPCDEACKECHFCLERVVLDRTAPGSRSLFDAQGYDLLVVTDGGFILEETAAKRVVLYCNSALREDGWADHLRSYRSPKGWLRRYSAKRHHKKLAQVARSEKVVLVPNSRDTMETVSRLVGKPTERHVYPPVDLEWFAALGPVPKERRIATVARFAPEKRLAAAAKITSRVGERWDVAGNALLPYQCAYLENVRRAAGPAALFHVNVGQGEIRSVVAGAKAYLHASRETFGIAVVEAIAAGCVPIVPDNTAHVETVPFPELRYGSESEAVEKLEGALDGRYDRLLPKVRRHVMQFSEHAFQDAMLEVIGAQDRRNGPDLP